MHEMQTISTRKKICRLKLFNIYYAFFFKQTLIKILIFCDISTAIYLIMNSSVVINSYIVIIRWYLQYISNENEYSFNC